MSQTIETERKSIQSCTTKAQAETSPQPVRETWPCPGFVYISTGSCSCSGQWVNKDAKYEYSKFYSSYTHMNPLVCELNADIRNDFQIECVAT